MSGTKKWDPERIKAAVTAIRKKEMGSFKASCDFRVPQTTLARYVNLESSSANRTETKLGREPVLSPSLEENLVQHCLDNE
jgi:hypothetical protein